MCKKEILLLSVGRVWRYPNTGVDQLAGYLRKNNYNIHVKYYHNNQSVTTIFNEIKNQFGIYAFSVNSSNYNKCIELSKKIKSSNQKSLIIFGGAFPTLYYREIIEDCIEVDYIILGDGEIPFEYFLENYDNKGKIDEYKFIASSLSIRSKEAFCNQKIDYSPIFDYYLNDKIEKNLRKVYCIQTKNNICTGKCSFCIERKGKVFYKEISQIVSEIKYIAENFGIKKVFFTDDNLFDPNTNEAKERVRELCIELKKMNLNLVYECYIKATSLKDTDYDNELLNLMTEVGFITIFVGIESGNNDDLKLYNKFTNVEDNYNIINLLKKHKISYLIGFIFFNPYSTSNSVRENYIFLKTIKSTNLFHYISTFLSIHKYTEIYDKVLNDNLLTKEFGMLNNNAYNFIDEDVNEIVNFIKENLSERMKNLEYELDWIYNYYEECIKLNKEASKYEKELLNMKNNQFELMTDFFDVLYIKQDIVKSQIKVDNFMSYFEGIQQDLERIYKDLVNMYSFN